MHAYCLFWKMPISEWKRRGFKDKNYYPRAEISRHICFTQQFKNTFRRQQHLNLNFTPPSTLRMPPLPFREIVPVGQVWIRMLSKSNPPALLQRWNLISFLILFNFDLLSLISLKNWVGLVKNIHKGKTRIFPRSNISCSQNWKRKWGKWFCVEGELLSINTRS